MIQLILYNIIGIGFWIFYFRYKYQGRLQGLEQLPPHLNKNRELIAVAIWFLLLVVCTFIITKLPLVEFGICGSQNICFGPAKTTLALPAFLMSMSSLAPTIAIIACLVFQDPRESWSFLNPKNSMSDIIAAGALISLNIFASLSYYSIATSFIEISSENLIYRKMFSSEINTIPMNKMKRVCIGKENLIVNRGLRLKQQKSFYRFFDAENHFLIDTSYGFREVIRFQGVNYDGFDEVGFDRTVQFLTPLLKQRGLDLSQCPSDS